MQTALRKMGNSTAMIVPKALLAEIGAASGTPMDICVEDGRLIATPMSGGRGGWAAAAAEVAAAEEDAGEAAWQGFGNDGDSDLAW